MTGGLRRKFVFVAMASVTLVLASIICAINVVNYAGMCDRADARLALIAENDGTYPGTPSTNPAVDRRSGPDSPERGMSAEAPFDTRYFTVMISKDGLVTGVKTDRIAAVSRADAEAYAKTLDKQGSTMGFYGVYRYRAVDAEARGAAARIMYVFLDCSRELSSCESFLIASAAISATGWLLVLGLVIVLSSIAIRPIAESYGKQRRFITDASHEFKTPLAVIGAACEVIELEGGANEWTQSIFEQVTRLSGLTDRLTMLARMDERTGVLTLGELDLSLLVSQASDPFVAVALSRGTRLARMIEAELSVRGDARALAQVVELLLDNATRYARFNSVIELSLSRCGRGVRIMVANQADELPSGNLDRLFERFHRADASRSSKTGGFGVGLSVVRAIVDAHGGSVRATTQGDTITFIIRL